MKVIHLTDCLKEMKKPEPFSITVVTYDAMRKKGGDILRLEKCMLPMHEDETSKFDMEIPGGNITDFKKNPGHYEHATRNVLLANGMMKKFHIRLLLEFNGKKVFY